VITLRLSEENVRKMLNIAKWGKKILSARSIEDTSDRLFSFLKTLQGELEEK